MFLNLKSLKWNLFVLFVFLILNSCHSQSLKSDYSLIAYTNKFSIYEKEVYLERKSFIPSYKYYFSFDTNNKVELTIINLKSVFKSYPSFCDALDIYFRSDAELTRYDIYNKEYLIIRLFTKYIK